MTYTPLLFWAMLFFPGYVVARRLMPDELSCGGLGIIGLAYFGVFALLSPISIACYLLGAPLAVMSAAVIILVAAGLIEITRRRWWCELARGLTMERSAVAIICAALLVVDLVFSVRTGAGLIGDAVVHLARIRHLLDHGFSNHDPFVAGTYFFPLYHTNLLHALYASCSQLTGIGHVKCWFISLPAAKLLIAAGMYYLTWTVFSRPWLAWIMVAFAIAWVGTTDFLIYPNKIAPRWLGPMMLGFTVRVIEDRRSWRMAIVLLCGAIIAGQIHSLYGAFFIVALGPVLLIRGGVDLIARRRDAAIPLACAAALLTVLPFGLISRQYVGNQDAAADASAHDIENEDEMSDVADIKWEMMAPRSGFGTVKTWRSWLLLPGIAVALGGTRRRHTGIVLLASGIVATIFFAAPLCTAAIGLLGGEWILGRFGFMLHLGFAMLAVGSFLYAFGQSVSRAWLRYALVIPTIMVGVFLASPDAPTAWTAYMRKAVSPAAIRWGRVAWTNHLRQFCQENIPHGSTVLAGEWRGMVLCSLCDVKIVAPRRASNGVPDLAQRHEDVVTMLHPNTDWPQRKSLLRKYGVEYLFFGQNQDVNWAWDHVDAYLTDEKFHAYKLDLEE